MPHPAPPSAIAAELHRLTTHELSLPSRLRHVVLLLIAAIMTSIVMALLLTEPGLPLRTALAFGVIAIIGATWMGFAAWVLIRKRTLLGHHRLVAARLAIVFSSVFVIAALAVGVVTSRTAPFAAAAMGLIMLVVAVVLLVRARRRFAALTKRREELEQLLQARKG